MIDDQGEYVFALGKYSMAPIFRAISGGAA
jgi:hypothetical protein